MYFFYIDESGSRDTTYKAGTGHIKDKDHVYVLLAVGMEETKWRKFDREITNLKTKRK